MTYFRNVFFDRTFKNVLILKRLLWILSPKCTYNKRSYIFELLNPRTIKLNRISHEKRKVSWMYIKQIKIKLFSSGHLLLNFKLKIYKFKFLSLVVDLICANNYFWRVQTSCFIYLFEKFYLESLTAYTSKSYLLHYVAKQLNMRTERNTAAT